MSIVRWCLVGADRSGNAARGKLENLDDLVLIEVKPLDDLIDRGAGFEIFKNGRDRHARIAKIPRRHSDGQAHFPRRSIATNLELPCCVRSLQDKPNQHSTRSLLRSVRIHCINQNVRDRQSRISRNRYKHLGDEAARHSALAFRAAFGAKGRFAFLSASGGEVARGGSAESDKCA